MALTSRHRRIGTAGVVLLLAGIVFAGLYRITAGTEAHAFAPGAVPPATVRVTSGDQYLISVPGGVAALQRRGTNPSTLTCQWSAPGAASRALEIQAAGAGTKATNAVASFTAPVTGAVHVDCTGWGAVFVDDADNAPGDLSGLYLVLCVFAFTLGAGLALSALRARFVAAHPASARPAGDDEEIERLVHVVRVRSKDGEVADPDRGDVTP